MKDRIKLRTIFFYLAVYLGVGAFSYDLMMIDMFVKFTVYVVFCFFLSLLLYVRERDDRYSNRDVFQRFFFLDKFVSEKVKFQHVFSYGEKILEDLEKSILKTLFDKELIRSSDEIIISDRDSCLVKSQDKRFVISPSVKTVRKSLVEFVLYSDSVGTMQNIQWWIIVQGFVSRDSIFSFVAKAPLTLPFLLIPILKKKYSIVESLRNTYYSSFDSIDLVKYMAAIFDASIDELVRQLDERGIDTTRLKEQKNQVLNINISGGKPILSNIIQGTRNIVSRGGGHGEAS